MFRLVKLIAASLVIVILLAMSLPIYKVYLIKNSTLLLVNQLVADTQKTLQAYAINNPWPQMNFGPNFAKPEHHEIPHKFHLIWVGGKIPDKYIKNIQTLTRLSKDIDPNFSINLWTDHGSRTVNAYEFSKITTLTIRNIEAELLYNVVATDSQYSTFEQENFMNWILFEYLAPANYAAIADLLRIEILRLEGGVYIDTDLEIISDTSFKQHILTLFNNVANHGGLSCLRNQRFTNNNLIVAAKDAATEQKLKALVNYMSISMSDKYLQQMQQHFNSKSEYLLAKKSPIPLSHNVTRIFRLFPQYDMPNLKLLTLNEGPYKLAIFSEQYLPTLSISKHIVGTPGLAEMELIFKCRTNDNNWLDKSTKTPHEKQKIVAYTKRQVDFYLSSIHNQQILNIGASYNKFSAYYPGLNLAEIFSDH